MWDENPRYLETCYRFLLWTTGIGLVWGLVLSLWSGDRASYWLFLKILGIALTTLCVYAALVWAVAHLAWILQRIARKLRYKKGED